MIDTLSPTAEKKLSNLCCSHITEWCDTVSFDIMRPQYTLNATSPGNLFKFNLNPSDKYLLSVKQICLCKYRQQN